jgi:glutamate carboxypeptidase
MMDEEANRVYNLLVSWEDQIKDFLIKLVETETPSSDISSQHEILALIMEKLHSINYKTTHYPGKKTGGFMVASPVNRDKQKKIQLLVGHCDTVWPHGTLERLPVTYKGKKIRGPGIFDMKAGLTQILFALACIEELNIELAHSPVVIINSDEEIGSRETTKTMERLAAIAHRAYVLEPPLGMEGRLKTARKGLGRFVITVKGKAAHAGLDPGKGASAIQELSYQIQRLFEMNDPKRGVTVNVGTIEGGVSSNVVAAESKCTIDVRVLKEKDGIRITKKIHKLKPVNADTELIIKGEVNRAPLERTPRNRVLWKIAKKNGQRLGIKLKQATVGGGSDGNTISQYTATLDGLGTVGDGAHADHEFIFGDKLVERTALLALMIMDDTQKKEESTTTNDINPSTIDY